MSAAVRWPESQVINTARYMGRPEQAPCVASNRGLRQFRRQKLPIIA